jgi:polysaccharide export outer membrane protein
MRYWVIFILVAAFLLTLSPLRAQELTSPFTLGPGDVLQVSVWKDEALTREVLVTPDGYISFPLIGQVKAAGKSVKEVQAKLKEGLEKYVPDSPVTVALRQLNSRKIYVVGKVNKPGTSLLQGKMTVMQALAASGGFTRFADKNGIVILRNYNDTSKAIPFDYNQVSQGEELKSNIHLMPGDTIVVP